MPQTISTQFSVRELPDWAQRQPDSVWLARRSLEFRVAVGSAETAQYQRFLAREATRRRDQVEA